MKKITLLFIVFSMCLPLLSCNSRTTSDDPFYNYSGEYSHYRFPLIKPYYADQLDGNSPWILTLFRLWAPPPHDDYSYWNVYSLQQLAVQNGVIMAYSPYIDEQANESLQEYYYHWFVIIPDKNLEMGFDNEEAFLDYIQELGITEPEWRKPEDVFKQFEQTGCLSWIPGCD